MEKMTLLHDDECENIVIGTILSRRGVLDAWREILSVNSFYNYKHQEIYKACLKVSDRGDEVNIISVMPELVKAKSNVTPYDLTSISGYCAVVGEYQYAARLHDLEKRRKLWDIGQRLITSGCTEDRDIVDVVSESEDGLKNLFSESPNNIKELKDVIEELYDQVDNNLKGKGEMTGTATGFSQLDEKGGLQGSDLIIIAGQTSNGKTSLALSITSSAIKSGVPVAFYTLEMSNVQLASRLASMECGIPSNMILYRKLSESQLSTLDKKVAPIMNCGLYFDERSTSNIDTIINSIRSMKKKYNIKGAVIDYLQILNVNQKGANKEQQMGEAARRLKNLAKELNIWIIALSQLSRNQDSPEPSMSRLRDSGQIAEAADIVILVYRPEIYGKKFPDGFESINTKGTALIDVAKGRNIGIMKFVCGFDPLRTKFYPLDDLPVELEDLPY